MMSEQRIGTSNLEVSSKHNGKAIASLVLGIIGLIAWFIPFFGYPITIVGLVLGVKGIKSQNRGMGIAGLVLSIIGLVFTLINSVIGAILGMLGLL